MKARKGAMTPHLSEDELIALVDEAGESIACALATLMDRARLDKVCVGCFARAMASALTHQAAWFGALAAEQTTDPAGAAEWLVDGFQESMRVAMQRQQPSAAKGQCRVQ